MMRLYSLLSAFAFYAIYIIDCSNGDTVSFPSDFIFGVATASYQIEGGWNASDKGESIWDRLTHTTNLVKDGSTGDFACDSYHQVERDIEMLKELGVNFYKFSISWPRLLPTGFNNKISTDGTAYYNRLINGLIAAGITPVGTLYHWDLPQSIQDLGGWLNPSIVEYITEYADVVFKLYGDRVKTWLTINEPWVVCVEGYGANAKAPAVNSAGTGDYLCGHNILKAHASIYHMYNRVYRSTQHGRIGLSLNAGWVEPTSQKPPDLDAADRSMQFSLGWFAHPIFSRDGDYPQVMKDSIAKNSAIQGLGKSRLPEFTQDELDSIRGSADFFGLNHYTSVMGRNPLFIYQLATLLPNYWVDMYVDGFQDPRWPGSASAWLKVVPWGFGKLLRWIRDQYGNPEVYVTENGFSDADEINDDDRITYYKGYMNSMLDAMADGCRVIAYTAWSLMDNFEWLQGYTEKFGLYHVDFKDPKRTRVPKKSAFFYRDVIAAKAVERV